MYYNKPLRRVNIKSNRRRRLVNSNLSNIDRDGQKAFVAWLKAHREAKRTQQLDLPSSQLVDKMDLLSGNEQQLFVVVDTCSIISHRTDFIDYVRHLHDIFPGNQCPVKMIICLAVLEELDKCNRPRKKNASLAPSPNPKTQLQDQSNVIIKTSDPQNQDLLNILNSNQAQKPSDPPRYFMRFLEEEMRLGQVLISELDPFKKATLSSQDKAFEIINKDDRILDCCIRTGALVRCKNRNPNTKVILVSEDNLFKSKATTYNVVSFRWTEFRLKFKNFGLKHYTQTPTIISSVNNQNNYENSTAKPASREVTSDNHKESTTSNTKGSCSDKSRSRANFVHDFMNKKFPPTLERRTLKQMQTLNSKPRASTSNSDFSDCNDDNDDVMIVKEVISMC